METIDNNQRYSIEKSLAEADRLRILIDIGKYATYGEAHYYLPDEDMEDELRDGYIDRLVREDLGMYVAPIDGGCPDTEDKDSYCIGETYGDDYDQEDYRDDDSSNN